MALLVYQCSSSICSVPGHTPDGRKETWHRLHSADRVMLDVASSKALQQSLCSHHRGYLESGEEGRDWLGLNLGLCGALMGCGGTGVGRTQTNYSQLWIQIEECRPDPLLVLSSLHQVHSSPLPRFERLQGQGQSPYNSEKQL